MYMHVLQCIILFETIHQKQNVYIYSMLCFLSSPGNYPKVVTEYILPSLGINMYTFEQIKVDQRWTTRLLTVD